MQLPAIITEPLNSNELIRCDRTRIRFYVAFNDDRRFHDSHDDSTTVIISGKTRRK